MPYLSFAQRPPSAISGLATLLRPNGSTEVTLPDATPFDRSQPGPKLPVATFVANV